MAVLTPRFFQIDYPLVKFLKCHLKAVVYARLRDWQDYAQAQEWAIDETTGLSAFYRLGHELVEETLVPERTLRRILAEFKENGWLKIERKGFDPKVWYTFYGATELSKNESAHMPKWHTAKCQNGIQPNAKMAFAHMPKWHLDLTINKEIKKEIKNIAEPLPRPAIVENQEKFDAEKKPKPKPKTENRLEIIKDPTPGSMVWNEYAKGIEQRYQTAPARSAKTNAQLSHLVSTYGLQTALKITDWYLGDNDAFIANQCHPLDLLLKNAHKYSIECNVGKRLTKTRAKRIERASDLEDSFEEIDHARKTKTTTADIFDEIEADMERLREERLIAGGAIRGALK